MNELKPKRIKDIGITIAYEDEDGQRQSVIKWYNRFDDAIAKLQEAKEFFGEQQRTSFFPEEESVVK